ncbi:MAG: cytochrome P450 [Actinomycetota bacterium]
MADRAADRLPPSPSISSLAALRMFREDPIGTLTALARDHGDIVSLDLGRLHVFLVSHPDYVKDILVANHGDFVKGPGLAEAKRLLGEGLLTSEGEFHRQQRHLIQPVFHHQRMTDYAELMVERAARVADGWSDGQLVDVQDEMVRLTMAVLAKAVLDTDIEDNEARETGQALAACLRMFARLASPYSRLLEQVQSEANREYQRVLRRFDATVLRMVEDRRARGAEGGDVLSRLIRARDDGATEGMSDRQVRDEIMTLMIAGHETWSNSMGWTWYLLFQHPTERERLHAELDAVLDGRLPTADDVPHLRYVDMAYSEALRLYPPAWTVGRAATVDHEINGYVIPAGSFVLISPYIVQRDPRWFPDPLEFRPERWAPGESRDLPTFAYFPFGAGPRVCIGQPLAKLACVLFIATIARRWRLELVPGHQVEPAPPLLRPAHGLPMTVHARG